MKTRRIGTITGVHKESERVWFPDFRRLGCAVVANSRSITESEHAEVIAVPGDISDPAVAE